MSLIRRAIARLPASARQEWRALILFGVIFLAATWLFYEVVEDMVWGDPLVAADTVTYAILQHLRSPILDRVMISVTELGDAPVVIAIGAVVAGWLIYKRAWRALAYWLLAVGGGSLINTAIKLAMHRARPGDLHYSGASVFSFPSGHSTTNAALYGFLLILIARELPLRTRLPIICTLIAFVGLIAFSRLYLGAHWLSDVGGGLTFGSAWLALLALFYMWRPSEPIDASKLLWVAGITLILAGGLNIAFTHSADLLRYTVRPSTALQPVSSS